VSADGIMKNWAKMVSNEFNGLYEDDIINLFTDKDKHWSDWRTRETWKAALAKGISGTPTAIVNGIKLNKYPKSAGEWDSFFEKLFSASNKYERNSWNWSPA